MSQMSLAARSNRRISMQVLTPALIIAMMLQAPTVAKSFEPVTVAAVTGFFAHWLFGKIIDLTWDNASGKPDIRQMKRELDELKKTDTRNAATIARLQRDLREGMTSGELKNLLMARLERIDKTLSEHAAKLKEHDRMIAELRAEFRAELEVIKKRFESHDKRLDTLDLKVVRLQIGLVTNTSEKKYDDGHWFDLTFDDEATLTAGTTATLYRNGEHAFEATIRAVRGRQALVASKAYRPRLGDSVSTKATERRKSTMAVGMN